MAFIAPSFFNFPYLATSPPAIVFFRIYTPAEVRSGYNEKITPGSSTAPSGRNMSSKIQFEERLGPKKSGFQVVEGLEDFGDGGIPKLGEGDVTQISRQHLVEH